MPMRQWLCRPALTKPPRPPSTPSEIGSRIMHKPKPQKQQPRFKFVADMPRVCQLVQLSAEQCTTLGVPPQSAQYLPKQPELEKWIFEKYIQYKRTYSAFDIFQSVCGQLNHLAATTHSIHPDYRSVLSNIYAECFPHEMPTALPAATRPKRKFCPNCSNVLSTDGFRSVRSNRDKFARLCIKCETLQSRKKQKRQQASLDNSHIQPFVPSADKLDNPDHDIDFDNLPEPSKANETDV